METTLVVDKFHEIINDFVSKKRVGACLISSTLFLKLAGRGELIQGYLVNDTMKSYVRHYWCCIDGKYYDTGTVINMILMPEIKRFGKRRCSTTAPIGYTYASSMDPGELMKLEEGYRLYTSNPKKFWKRSPRWMRNIIKLG